MTISTSYDWTLTRTEIITAALRKLMVLPSGGVPNANQLADGVVALNAAIKALQAKGMAVWAINETTFTTVSGTASYAIGPGQTINLLGTPLKVLQAFYTPTGGNNTPLNVYNRYDFKDLPRNSTITGTPVNLYYQPNALYGQIDLWPYPSDSTTVITLEYQRPFGDMDSATDNLDFPSYWTEAIIYRLAHALAPEYGTPPTDRGLLKAEARDAVDEALSYGSEEGSVFMQPNWSGQ
jgi:hypothetical protein